MGPALLGAPVALSLAKPVPHNAGNDFAAQGGTGFASAKEPDSVMETRRAGILSSRLIALEGHRDLHGKARGAQISDQFCVRGKWQRQRHTVELQKRYPR